ncbi:hypothetical protein ANCCEY_06057 [Ancylostoma ceylanicum]|uniref:Uncharacterized protein n=1 Tax=Ancylostoma ceylanicum TaxID=53326 RepID=A0A0D6LUI7_9BILA|nr:hypothetical protein ANCCEY_06057 [Ancylostoma ceylanicum]
MSNCTSIQDTLFEAIDLTAVRALFAVLYSLVWVAAIVGNTLVLYVVSFNQGCAGAIFERNLFR